MLLLALVCMCIYIYIHATSCEQFMFLEGTLRLMASIKKSSMPHLVKATFCSLLTLELPEAGPTVDDRNHRKHKESQYVILVGYLAVRDGMHKHILRMATEAAGLVVALISRNTHITTTITSSSSTSSSNSRSVRTGRKN